MKQSILACLTALALVAMAAPAGALAQSGQGSRRVTPPDAKVMAHLREARTKNRRVTINFRSGGSVTGQVGEPRERGLTFEPDRLSPELRRQQHTGLPLKRALPTRPKFKRAANS